MLDAWILELHSKGKNGIEISKAVGISEGAISRRLKKLRAKAHENISIWATQTLPWEFERAVKSLDQIHREAWLVAEKAADERTKLQALSLAREATQTRIDLLTHSQNIESVIKWANQKLTTINDRQEKQDAKGSTEDNRVTATQ
jgi:DNA-binding transcriptional regulator LsrR (DeoR family)